MKKLDKKNIEDILTLTSMQEGMLFFYLKDPKNDLYFEQLCLEAAGEIDSTIFEQAWNLVIKTNEMLRTLFRWKEVKKPMQIILKQHELRVNLLDYSDADKKYLKLKEEKPIEDLKKEDRKKKFDLTTVPFRVTLCKLAKERYVILVSQHHILYDGWSTGIILKEFLAFYNALKNGEPVIIPVKNKFKEFVKWLQIQDKEKQKTYWKTYLKNFEGRTSIPVKQGKEKGSNVTRKYNFRISQKVTKEVETFLKEEKITLAALLYSVWGILLQKYNDSQDVIFGTTVSGRTAKVKDIEHMVGLFINTIPLRLNTSANKEISALLKEVNQSLQIKEEYETTSLTDIKEYTRTSANEELFDSIVVIENYPLDNFLTQQNNTPLIKQYSMFYKTNFDLTVAISALTVNDIEITFTYEEGVFSDTSIENMGLHFEKITGEIAGGSVKWLHEIDILTDIEKKQLLIDFNSTGSRYPCERTIHECFEEQVEKTGDNTAVIGMAHGAWSMESVTVTYRKLNEKVNQLARLLKKKGVMPESVVGVMMEPAVKTIVTLLAILKAGGAYLPIDPGTPVERIRFMLENAGARILLTNSLTIKDMSFTLLQNFESNTNIKIVKTTPREPINAFDQLPMPDRSLINLRNYKDKIGMASVTDCISIQTTRGCPYECLYCHKIWSKKHVHRSAENIYNEIEYYYRNGVTNFAFIDDCFNLNRENSTLLFKRIIQNKLNIQLFFPNGLRGDIMTPDYIDRMVEAGTRGINLSLETASPRLQKLLKKNLDLDKFKSVVDYIAHQHPEVMLEMASMHGFPTETEEEAMKTLNFIKDIKWLHFPYIHILKIFPNTEMEAFALGHGISKKDIMISKDRAFHELPETLPFPKSFTRKYQANFMNEYFLSKERLHKVLPVQMKILNQEALAQKYNAYLPVEITCAQDIIDFAHLDGMEIPVDYSSSIENKHSIFDRKNEIRAMQPSAKKILFLDLSQHFSSHSMLYNVAEQPLGEIYLLTYLKQRFGDKIDGKIYKSGNDFDSFEELKFLLDEYQPHLIGVRTLTFFKEFFHETVSQIRQWGFDVPIITGGPYASSDYDTILKDKNIDLVMFGEGEYSLSELIEKMLENDFKLPGPDDLMNIKGIAFTKDFNSNTADKSINILLLDRMADSLESESTANPEPAASGSSLAYVMYTSGSTGRPKGVMVEHRQVNNCLHWMQEKFDLTSKDVIVQRTNLTFDPSVWEIFWPLSIGGSVRLLTAQQSKDAEFLIHLMADDLGLSMIYCPASLVNAMAYVLSSKNPGPLLKLPWLIIGAEPIKMEVVKNFYSYFQGKIVNTYGPTECTINNTYYDLESDARRSIVPIGRPVTNNKVYILSRDLQLMPLFTTGEICISGDSVARGYINNPGKTNNGFINNPFGQGKLYMTGDMGRWLDDGTIEIMGRIDEQVKIRGYRIEPEEIERVLLKHQAVNDCVVVVRDNQASNEKNKEEVKICKRCGITSKYPNTFINHDGFCEICGRFEEYQEHLQRYFKTPRDLEQDIKEANKVKKSNYDCLLLYSGGRGSAYALYQLKDMGFNVLAVTYDNGYFGKGDLKNIKKITSSLGVDHMVLTHNHSDQILGESLKVAHTVCRGCFHTSFSLAAEYAFKNDIKVVVGATLSRGQIIENKVFMFLQQGITDVRELEQSILDLQKSAVDLDKTIFDRIDIDVVRGDALFEQVTFIDFYRYYDITNEEMITYLDNRDPFWKSRKTFAIYSTNCPIKQIGDYAYLQERAFHFYGSATSWEKRLGHLTLENLKEDLTCGVTHKAYENFAQRIGYLQDIPIEVSDKYLCAYFTSPGEVSESELKEYLSGLLPDYMIPPFFVQLEKLPLSAAGKIDRKALPESNRSRSRSSATYVAPKDDFERKIAEIWKEALKLDRVGLNDNFFDLGGNSLNVIQVSGKLKEVTGHEIAIVTLFTYPTIGSLANNLKNEKSDLGFLSTTTAAETARHEEREKGKHRLRQRMIKRRAGVPHE